MFCCSCFAHVFFLDPLRLNTGMYDRLLAAQYRRDTISFILFFSFFTFRLSKYSLQRPSLYKYDSAKFVDGELVGAKTNRSGIIGFLLKPIGFCQPRRIRQRGNESDISHSRECFSLRFELKSERQTNTVAYSDTVNRRMMLNLNVPTSRRSFNDP